MSDEAPRTRRRIHSMLGARDPVQSPQPADPAPPAAPAADSRFPGWVREGEFFYRRKLHFPGRAVELWDPAFSPEAESADGLVFYDTETTGLSGGAGSVIFLFGAAWCKGEDLRFEQLFLSDFPGEPEFLMAVEELLRPFTAWVSYNGKTFDSHLLREPVPDERHDAGAGTPGGPAAPCTAAVALHHQGLQPEDHRKLDPRDNPGHGRGRGRHPPCLAGVPEDRRRPAFSPWFSSTT